MKARVPGRSFRVRWAAIALLLLACGKTSRNHGSDVPNAGGAGGAASGGSTSGGSTSGGSTSAGDGGESLGGAAGEAGAGGSEGGEGGGAGGECEGIAPGTSICRGKDVVHCGADGVVSELEECEEWCIA